MTKYAICLQSIIPVRKQPSDQSEMINQLIFGDLLTILDTKNSWLLTSTVHDEYEGWVDIKQITIIEYHEFERLKNEKPVYLTSICGKAITKEGKTINLLLGSQLAGYKEKIITIYNETYLIEGDIQDKTPHFNSQYIVDVAMKYLGVPYLWGGRSPMGIDCSGLTQIVFGMAGKKIARDAYLQAEQGETINFIEESKSGDLAFFDNTDESITHVGIIIDNKHIIHASGEVRIDNIDHQGIYNEKLKKYTHKLRIIKRII